MSNAHKIIISCILGLCFIGGSLAIGLSFFKTKAPVRTVSVVGMAEKDFSSDLIVQTFTISAFDQNLKAGYEKIKNDKAVVKKFLKEKGIKTEEINYKPITTEREEKWVYNPQAGRGDYQFEGYKIIQEVRIESKDMQTIENLNLADLMSEEINIEINDPGYYYTKLSDLKIEMLANATKDAKHRAETIVSNAGGKLGSLKVSNMGVFQITSPNSDNENYEWGGAFNTTSKKKRASITMRLTYYVK